MRQRGNILFLILLAVVLFAALAYAVTSSMRGGGNDSSKENAKLAASQLMNYATLVENAVMRMSFSTPPQNIQYWTGANSGCTTTSCRLFHPDGGGVADIPIDKKYLLGPPAGGWEIRLIRVAGVGTDKPEIAIGFFGIKKEICQAINEMAGITTNSSYGVPVGATIINSGGVHLLNAPYAPQDVLVDTTFFRYVRVGETGVSPEVANRTSFCICDNVVCSASVGYRYQYWHVLVAQ